MLLKNGYDFNRSGWGLRRGIKGWETKRRASRLVGGVNYHGTNRRNRRNCLNPSAQSVACRPTCWVLPGNLLEMQTPAPDLVNENPHFQKTPRWLTARVEKHRPDRRHPWWQPLVFIYLHTILHVIISAEPPIKPWGSSLHHSSISKRQNWN